MPYQLFLIGGFMDLTLKVEPKSKRFDTREEAMDFYDKGKFAGMSRGSTEDNEEYKILEVRNGKLFRLNSSLPVRRDSDVKGGDFVVITDANGADRIFVETTNGLQELTWRDY